MGWTLTELHEVNDDSGKYYVASQEDIWKFKYNISIGETTQNTSKTQQDTLGRFPKFTKGLKNCLSGNVSCLLGRDVELFDWSNVVYKYNSTTNQWNTESGNWYNNGGYKEELWPSVQYGDKTSNKKIDMLKEWQKFCYSGNPKLLKDSIGRQMIVQIHDTSYNIEETWERRPTTISFNWIEIEDASKAQIISTDSAIKYEFEPIEE